MCGPDAACMRSVGVPPANTAMPAGPALPPLLSPESHAGFNRPIGQCAHPCHFARREESPCTHGRPPALRKPIRIRRSFATGCPIDSNILWIWRFFPCVSVTSSQALFSGRNSRIPAGASRVRRAAGIPHAGGSGGSRRDASNLRQVDLRQRVPAAETILANSRRWSEG